MISGYDRIENSVGKGERTLWGKEKMLVTSIFSFSHSVFKKLFSQGLKSRLCGKELNQANCVGNGGNHDGKKRKCWLPVIL